MPASSYFSLAGIRRDGGIDYRNFGLRDSDFFAGAAGTLFSR